jgi:hypothetical protein
MARWPINAHPIIMMMAIAIGLDHISIGCCQIDCNLLGLCINNYIIESIAISLDHISIGISLNQLQSAWIGYGWASTVVLMVGLMVGSIVGCSIDSTWPCWAINLREAFDSSDKKLLRLSAKRV